MDYVLLIHAAEDSLLARTAEEQHQMLLEYGKFTRELLASGKLGDCDALEPTRTATTLRIRDGKRVITDGPFAETREQLGGYYVVKAETFDDAIAIAGRIPGSRTIEVRPVIEGPPEDPVVSEVAPPPKAGREYILLIYEDEKLWAKLNPTETAELFGRYAEFTLQIRASGHFVAGAPLASVDMAKTVRAPSGKSLVTDGPFAETREQLGGYYRVRAEHLDQAIDMAARIPAAETGAIEVRPVKDLSAYA